MYTYITLWSFAVIELHDKKRLCFLWGACWGLPKSFVIEGESVFCEVRYKVQKTAEHRESRSIDGESHNLSYLHSGEL